MAMVTIKGLRIPDGRAKWNMRRGPRVHNRFQYLERFLNRASSIGPTSDSGLAKPNGVCRIAMNSSILESP
jgi:hypothetical protein